MVTSPKSHYEKFDFIDPSEEVYIEIGRSGNALLEHSHDFFELIIVIHGNGTHQINGESFQVMVGDIFLLTPQDKHSFIPVDGKIEFQWIDFIWSADYLDIQDSFLLQNKKYRDTDIFSITNMVFDALQEFHHKESDYLNIIKYQLYVIIKKMCRLAQQQNISYAQKRSQRIISRAISYLNNNYHEPVSLKDVSDSLSISQAYLCKLFKKEMGVPVIHYLRNIRLNHAVQLLISTPMQVQEVSETVGFSDVKSFFVAFKNTYGVTPSEYRKHLHH